MEPLPESLCAKLPVAGAAVLPLHYDATNGHTALVVKLISAGEASSPCESSQVWFRDLSGSWWLIATTFTRYLRILLAHFGVWGWEYVFTDIGLDPHAEQWLQFVSPGRRTVDLNKKEFPIQTLAWNPDTTKSSTDSIIKLHHLDKDEIERQREKQESKKRKGKPADDSRKVYRSSSRSFGNSANAVRRPTTAKLRTQPKQNPKNRTRPVSAVDRCRRAQGN